MRTIALLAILSPAFAFPSAGQTPAQPGTVEIREWDVPWKNTRPRDPYVDAQGKIWFVGQTGHYVATLDPESGKFTRYELEPGTGPHNLIVDPRGTVWYAGNLTRHIGRLDPATGKIEKIAMPDTMARDPHTLVFDSKGDIWFTVQGGGYVGRLTVANRKVDLVKIPTARSRPYGILLDASGRPWFNQFGTNKVGTIDPATMQLREYDLPDAAARGRRIGITPDGGVWYVDHARGFLSRLDPATGKVEEWPAPSGGSSRPYAMTTDDRGRVWYVETGVQPNRLVGFDPKTRQTFSVTSIASGGGTVRHMVFHAPTRTIWFGTDAGTIGRARVP